MANHQAAYDTFQGVLHEAEMSAKNQSFFINFTIGVVASLAAGPLVGGQWHSLSKISGI